MNARPGATFWPTTYLGGETQFVSEGYAVFEVGSVTAQHGNEWVSWWPMRRELGIDAFGCNVWIAEREGDELIGEHDESDEGHEELYIVMLGHAAFTVDGDDVDVPAGTVVFVRPGVSRIAVARMPNTRIVAIGAKPGGRSSQLAGNCVTQTN